MVTGDRVVDGDRHHWPVTGYVCRVCHWPADPVLATSGTHSTCAPLSGGGDLRDALRLVQAELGAEILPDGAA